jgi:uncharacterized membrane protein
MSKFESVVTVYRTHLEAEKAVKELQRSGIDMRMLSIVAKEHHTQEQVVGYYLDGDRMKRWGKAGAVWGGFWGILFGSAVFIIPGFGPLLVAGPLVARIVAALEGGAVVGGLSAIGTALSSVGVPKDSALEHETALKDDKFLLIVNATAPEVSRTKEILASLKSAHLKLHPEEDLVSAG